MRRLTTSLFKEEVSARAEARIFADRARKVYGVDVMARTRMAEVVHARRLVIWLLRERGYSLSNIAVAVGLTNHATVIHALKRVHTLGLAGEAAQLEQDQAA